MPCSRRLEWSRHARGPRSLSLRLVDAGYVIRLGRAEPIEHRESPTRSWCRLDINHRRNEELISWTYFPFPWNLLYMAATPSAGFIWRGRLRILGAGGARVRADWGKMNRMTFRHVERNRCNRQ